MFGRIYVILLFWTYLKLIQKIFRWCSNEVKDFLKKELIWAQEQRPSNSCVYVLKDHRSDILSQNPVNSVNCDEKLRFICEVQRLRMSGLSNILDWFVQVRSGLNLDENIVSECKDVVQITKRNFSSLVLNENF